METNHAQVPEQVREKENKLHTPEYAKPEENPLKNPEPETEVKTNPNIPEQEILEINKLNTQDEDFEEVNKFDIPKQEREKGNKFWKEEDYLNASKSYSKALLAFNHLLKQGMFASEEEARDMVVEVQVPSLLNLAACYLKLNYGYSNVVIYCSDVLKIQENNITALYRRAIAYTFLDQFEEAQADIKLAMELEPENQALKKIQKDLISRKNAYREKTRRIAQKAFGGTKKEVVEAKDSDTSTEQITYTPWWKCGCCKRKNKTQ